MRKKSFDMFFQEKNQKLTFLKILLMFIIELEVKYVYYDS